MDRPPDFLWVGNHPATDLCNTHSLSLMARRSTCCLTRGHRHVGPTRGLATCSDTSQHAEREAPDRPLRAPSPHGASHGARELPRDGAAVETLNAVLAEQAGAPFVNVTSDPPHRLSWSADVCRAAPPGHLGRGDRHLSVRRRTRAEVHEPRLCLSVSRHQQERPSPLVRHGDVRQPPRWAPLRATVRPELCVDQRVDTSSHAKPGALRPR